MLPLRSHQLECLDAIDKHFESENSRGLIKMFCGAGKSLVIYNSLIKHGGNLSVVVVPSINLITQFNSDYLIKYASLTSHDYKTLTVCSANEIVLYKSDFTTKPETILEFLESDDTTPQIILITYQSLETLFNVIEKYEYAIDLICFDEAHHVVADGIQDLLFGPQQDEYSDQRYGFIDSNVEHALFFTATPINKNGICMFNLDNHITIGDTNYEILDTLDVNECSSEDPHCGEMIYEYMHIDGVNDNVLNDFDIRVDLYTEEGDISIFEAIARTILETGNSRVLTFHSRSETSSDKSSDVLSFYSESNKRLFKRVFDKVLAAEFPRKAGFYKKITLTGITGNTKNRTKILGIFDSSHDDEIYLLGSCETIGEGVDTKSANMCVFVDPKQSYVKIIQNIGRICRKQADGRNGTVLIPAQMDVEKYKDCEDAVARDRIIREEMSKTGDFNGILNCLSALRQEDPYMFELCLKYPDVFTKKEMQDNFRKNGLVLDDMEYSGSELFEDLGVEYKDTVSEKANFNMLSRKLGTNIQVRNQKILDEDLYIDRGYEKTTHFVKTEDYKYMRVSKDAKKKTSSTSGCREIKRPHRNAKPFVHANSDIRVLWKFTSDLDVGKSVFGGYIEADVVVDNEEMWFEKLEEVKNYMDINGKRPSEKIKGKTGVSLGSWISTQVQNYKHTKNNMKIPVIRQAWVEFMADPKYLTFFTGNEAEWYNNLAEVKTYMDTHNKRPNNKDVTIKKLGYWISDQIYNYKNNKSIMKILKICQAWEDFINDPKYIEYFIDEEEQWFKNLRLVKHYMDTNNKRPSINDKDVTIKNLSYWFSNQQQNYKKNKSIMKISKIMQVWEDFTNDPKYYNYCISCEQKWVNTLEQVKNYMDSNNSRPSQHNNDTTVKNLGRWITQQTINHKKNKDIMKEFEIRKLWEDFNSDPKYSKYFITNNTQWNNTLEQVKNYMDIYNKRPGNKDTEPNIQTLGCWLTTQQRNYKQNKVIMTNFEIHQAWEDFTNDPKYSKYFITNNTQWHNTLEQVKNYMDTENKRPCPKNKSMDIRSLGNWISDQLKNYKQNKAIMSNPEIRQAWEDFTNDPKYSQYFTKESKPSPKSITIKPKIKTIDEPKETEVQKSQRKQSEYQELSKKMATQKSETTNQMFTTTPSLWHEYHNCRDFSFKGYDKPDEIPLNKIIKYLETKKNHKLNILDLGCGRNLIQEHFKDNKKFTITGYDYVGYNGSKVADISSLPEDDESVKVCVYSQALMGSNWKDYLVEGYRVLEYNGEMIISESVERYTVVKEQLEAIGMHVIREEYAETNRWFYIYAIKQ